MPLSLVFKSNTLLQNTCMKIELVYDLISALETYLFYFLFYLFCFTLNSMAMVQIFNKDL